MPPVFFILLHFHMDNQNKVNGVCFICILYCTLSHLYTQKHNDIHKLTRIMQRKTHFFVLFCIPASSINVHCKFQRTRFTCLNEISTLFSGKTKQSVNFIVASSHSIFYNLQSIKCSAFFGIFSGSNVSCINQTIPRCSFSRSFKS